MKNFFSLARDLGSVVALALFGSVIAIQAEVKRASVFSDHKVLQRDQPVHV